MKVTLEVILKGDSYAPLPGTEYEVAEGCTVTLLRPSYALRTAAFEATQQADADDPLSDVAVAKIVTRGAWPAAEEADPAVTARVIEDFFTAARVTPRTPSAS